MKKFLGLLMFFVLTFCFAGCGSDEKSEPVKNEVKTVEQQKSKYIYDDSIDSLVSKVISLSNSMNVSLSEPKYAYVDDKKDLKCCVMHFGNFEDNSVFFDMTNDEKIYMAKIIVPLGDIESSNQAGTILGATLLSLGVNKNEFKKFYEEYSKCISDFMNGSDIGKLDSEGVSVKEIFVNCSSNNKEFVVNICSKDPFFWYSIHTK